MGKTQPTYRDKLRRLESDWEPFERALRSQYQDDWSQLWTHARNYADAAGMQNEVTTIEPFLVTVCLGQQKQIRELEERVCDLESRAQDLESSS